MRELRGLSIAAFALPAWILVSHHIEFSAAHILRMNILKASERIPRNCRRKPAHRGYQSWFLVQGWEQVWRTGRHDAHCLHARQTRTFRRNSCFEADTVQELASHLHVSVQVRSGNSVQLLAHQTRALHVAIRGQLSSGQLLLHRSRYTRWLRLTYSITVFCNSTGNAKIGGSSEALDSAAAAPAEGG